MIEEIAPGGKAPVARGQFRAANALYPGLVVRVVDPSPYVPGHWICRSHPSGGKFVLAADELGEEIPDPYLPKSEKPKAAPLPAAWGSR